MCKRAKEIERVIEEKTWEYRHAMPRKQMELQMEMDRLETEYEELTGRKYTE